MTADATDPRAYEWPSRGSDGPSGGFVAQSVSEWAIEGLAEAERDDFMDALDGCLHPGEHTPGVQCPDCGRFSRHGWSWSTYGPDGYYASWGGICGRHGEWSDST